jgi:hypothetical protein
MFSCCPSLEKGLAKLKLVKKILYASNNSDHFVTVKPKFSLEFNLEEYDKDGQKHLKVKGQKFHWEAELLKFNFENLFGGDKALSDNINKVMNENWQPVFEDVGSSYSEALGQIFAAIANEFFAKVSVLELFGEE